MQMLESTKMSQQEAHKANWGEYAHTILSKLEELHKDNKQTQRDIAEIKLAIVKLELNKEEVTS